MSTPSSSILVAIDFSTGSRAALEHAARLATGQGAKLHVLHVIDELALCMLADRQKEPFVSAAQTATESGRRALDTWLARSPLPAGYEVTLVIGNPLHEILEHVKSLQAKLVVVGVVGAGGSTAGAGSISTKLARKSTVSVLLVRSGHPQPFEKVLAGIDLSPRTPFVVQAAHDIALLEGAAVDWLHVWSDPGFMMPLIGPFGESGLGMATPEMPQHEELVKDVTVELHAAVHDASSGLVTCEVLRDGTRVSQAIEDYARESGADLIVLGARGHTSLHYILLGSTPERVIARLTCSMLVVKCA